MKTKFELDKNTADPGVTGVINIIGRRPDDAPYVSITFRKHAELLWIKDKDLERFAVNILKALKSKRLAK